MQSNACSIIRLLSIQKPVPGEHLLLDYREANQEADLTGLHTV